MSIMVSNVCFIFPDYYTVYTVYLQTIRNTSRMLGQIAAYQLACIHVM